MGARGGVLSQLIRFALEKISLGCRKFTLLETTSVMDSLHVLLVLEVMFSLFVCFVNFGEGG